MPRSTHMMAKAKISELSEGMFDAAKVPGDARNNYYRAFNQYIYNHK